jgi:transposase
MSAMSTRGELKFMTNVKNINDEMFIEFLKRLIAKAERPIFLILEYNSVHRSVEMLKFVESTKGKLRLFFLPPYSPELNPDKQAWNYLKNHKIGRQIPSGTWDLYIRVTKVMRSPRKSTEKIQTFFRHRWTMYTLMSAN